MAAPDSQQYTCTQYSPSTRSGLVDVQILTKAQGIYQEPPLSSQISPNISRGCASTNRWRGSCGPQGFSASAPTLNLHHSQWSTWQIYGIRVSPWWNICSLHVIMKTALMKCRACAAATVLAGKSGCHLQGRSLVGSRVAGGTSFRGQQLRFHALSGRAVRLFGVATEGEGLPSSS